jgi:hypothetical protein
MVQAQEDWDHRHAAQSLTTTGVTIAVSTRTAGALIGRAPFDEKHVAAPRRGLRMWGGECRSGENDVLEGCPDARSPSGPNENGADPSQDERRLN